MLLLMQHPLQAEDYISLQCLAKAHVVATSHAVHGSLQLMQGSQCCNVSSAASDMLLISTSVCMKGPLRQLFAGSGCVLQASLKAGSSGRTELRPAETSVIGAIAGAVTGFATTPLDVVKTRLMTQGERGQYKGCCGLRPSDLQRGGLRCLSQGECALTQCLSCNFSGVYG